MEKLMDRIRLLLSYMAGGVILSVILLLSLVAAFATNIWIGTSAFIGLAGSFLFQGLRRIPAVPPHVGLVTILGKRVKRVKKEGWRFFPLYPWLVGFVPVKVEKVNQDFEPQEVRTPDFAELAVPVSLTWQPGSTKPEFLADALIEFINSGGEKGVRTILEDIIHERLRAWAISGREGPQDWKRALAAREEAVGVLCKAVIAEELKPIPSALPTPILMRYFAGDPPADEREKEEWGENWDKLENLLKKEFKKRRTNSENLKTALEERRAEIKKFQRGNGVGEHRQLGIVLNRLNIGEIKIRGELAKAAELQAKEERDREAEKVELAHIRERVLELGRGTGFSSEQALEIIQTERGKVKKDISETKLNISPETRQLIGAAIGRVVSVFEKRWYGRPSWQRDRSQERKPE